MKVSELMAAPINEAKGFKLGDPLTDSQEVLDAFIDYAIDHDIHETAHDMVANDPDGGPDEGTDHMVRQMEMWLDDGNYKDGEVEAFMDKYQDDIHDHIYNGLT